MPGRPFLNKAIVIDEMFEPFRDKQKSSDGSYVYRESREWFSEMFNVLERADLKDRKKPEAVRAVLERRRKETVNSNVIPIGIINAEAMMLTEQQARENISAKSEGRRPDAASYEQLEMILPGLLQDEVFQGEVQFRISPELVQSNIDNGIEYVEIDFKDGKRPERYPFIERLIGHSFTATGETSITVTLGTKRGVFVSDCIVKVRSVERIFPNIMKAIPLEEDRNARTSGLIPGGEYAIYLGCDNVLDKPIIIAEGIDLSENVDVSELYVKYAPFLSRFRNNGYDLVFLDYNDGRASIPINAQVLKTVIRDMKNQIPAGENIIVVGESMSGLVARWALREMENAGEPHRVNLFVAFDTPNQGANVPPGLIELGNRLPSLTGWANPIANLFPFMRAMHTPAAQQMLLYSQGSSPHPAFSAFYQALGNLGNGGYPSQSRNVALVSGSLTGVRQNHYLGSPVINPGDKILDFQLRAILTMMSIKSMDQ